MKATLALTAIAALTAKVSAAAADCYGYPCCTENVKKVAAVDEKGEWGIENNTWCYIGAVADSKQKRQWGGNQWGGNQWGGNQWNQGGNQWNQGGNQWNQGGNQWNQWNQGNNQGNNQWNQWNQGNNQGNNQWNQWNQGGQQQQNNQQWNQGGQQQQQNNQGQQQQQNNQQQQQPAQQSAGGGGGNFCSSASHSGQSVQVNSNKVGTIGSIGYELWSDSGSNSATFYSDGSFSCKFQNAGDYLCRTGLSFDSTKTPSQIGRMKADFKLVKGNVSNAQYSYVGIYGWTRSPLVEYYIVDNWLSPSRPGDWVGNRKLGTFTIDGAQYTVYENTRTNAPSIDGNTTFKQYFSIRQTARDCGTIDISAHFDQWEKLGLQMGKLHEAKILGEAGGGVSGSIDFPYAKVYIGGSNAAAPQPQPQQPQQNNNQGQQQQQQQNNNQRQQQPQQNNNQGQQQQPQQNNNQGQQQQPQGQPQQNDNNQGQQPQQPQGQPQQNNNNQGQQPQQPQGQPQWNQGGNPFGGNQGGNPWGGQGGNPWGGNQGGNPWGGNQGGNPWGGNQGGNPWGGNQGQQGGQQQNNNNNQGQPPQQNDNNQGQPPQQNNNNNQGQSQGQAPAAQGGSSSYPYPLKNAAVPSKGCGKNPSLPKSGQFDFQWSGGKRMVIIDAPENYDSSKPYRLIFGMQCMGGSAQNVRSEGYYGLKPLDSGKTTIFVAPQGNGQQLPWGEADYKLFDELLDKLKSEFCIDESRVFSTGFSYGSMYTNGLSWNHQKVLRAVAVYETAERNIALPQNTGDGIGWMGVLGFDDNLCTPEMGRKARDIILKNNAKGNTSEKAQEAAPNGPHKCYDYTSVDEKFPLRWCTQSGGHLWDHKDPGQGQSWVPKETWDFFSKF